MAASTPNGAGLRVYAPAFFLALVATLLLTGCAGAGSSGSNNTSSTSSSAATSAVTGTAASGNPIAGATVTLEDSTGKSATSTTGADGTFSVNTTGLTPPFFVKVQPANSSLPALYSVSADANATTNINIHPLTDLIVRSWYTAQGLTADAAFTSPTGPNAPPTPLQVKIIANVVLQVVQLWLVNNGIDVTKVDLIATPFLANGTGLDKVLDETKINLSNGQVTITDGTTTQTSTASYNAGTVTITTTTTNSSGSTSSTVSTVIPTGAQETLVDAIQARMNALANVINTQGAALLDTDVLPYFAPDLLDGGLSQAQFAAEAAGTFRGLTVSFSVLRVVSVDTTNGTADVVFTTTRSLNGASQTQTNEFTFKNEGGTWYVAGDRRIARISLQAEMRTNQGAYAQGNGPDINLDVQSPQGTIGIPTVSGGNIWTSAALCREPPWSTLSTRRLPQPRPSTWITSSRTAGP